MNLKNFNINKNAFTLIEMLVVVAVIGLLSSVLLTSLGPAKDKARDSRIIQELGQLRVLAMSMDNGVNYSQVPDIAPPYNDITNQNILSLINDINANGGEVHLVKSNNKKSFVIYTRLNSKSYKDGMEVVQYYCLDSGGRSAFLLEEPDDNDIKNSDIASCNFN